MINFNRSISLCLMTLAAHRTSFTTLCTVYTYLTNIATGTGARSLFPSSQFLCSRAYPEVLLRIVKELLYQKRLALLLSLLLHMKVIVLHIRNYSFTLHEFIILLTALTCICHHLFTLSLILMLKALQVGC